MYQAIVFLPLLAAIAAGLFSLREQHSAAAFVTIGGVIASLLLSCFAFVHIALGSNALTVEVARWIGSGDFQAHWALRFDTLTAVMLIVVTLYSLCAYLFSWLYVATHHAPALWPISTCLPLPC